MTATGPISPSALAKRDQAAAVTVACARRRSRSRSSPGPSSTTPSRASYFRAVFGLGHRVRCGRKGRPAVPWHGAVASVCRRHRGARVRQDRCRNGIIAEHSRVLEASKRGLEKALITITPATRGPPDIWLRSGSTHGRGGNRTYRQKVYFRAAGAPGTASRWSR